jgi:4-amino-4-deoxy-L-arabinose transferase-like glycosyltransferase
MQRAPIAKTVLMLVASRRVVFLVALIARLSVLAQLLPANAWRDFYQYNEPSHIAWSMVSGSGYSSPWANTLPTSTAQQPPVYPYLLAGIFKLAGAYSYLALWIAVGLNAVISSFTAVVILQIGKRIFGTPTGVLAAWIWSCWIYEAVISIRLWESSLSALLLAVGLWLLPELAGWVRPGHWISFGALAGVAALTNTTSLSVFPFFWLWLWLSCRRGGLSCGRWLTASVVVCVLVVLPWTIRNYTVFHRLMPIRDNFGLELWIGNHEGVTHIFDRDFPLLDPTEYNRMGEIRFMETKRDIALKFIGDNPATFFRLSARRCYQFWTSPEKSAWLGMSVLAWIGLVLALRRKGFAAIPFAIVMLVFPFAYYVTHVFSSYRHPIEWAILLLAAYTMVSVVEPAEPLLLRRRLIDTGV